MFFIRAIVQIFSFDEKLNVLFNLASPRLIEHLIFHLMKISVPSHSLFVYYFSQTQLDKLKRCCTGKYYILHVILLIKRKTCFYLLDLSEF